MSDVLDTSEAEELVPLGEQPDNSAGEIERELLFLDDRFASLMEDARA